MQQPQNNGPVLPGDDARRYPGQPYPQQGQPQPPYYGRPKPRHGRFRRFVRGYLMLVGGLTTLYVLVMLLVSLFVEIGKWTPTLPMG